MNKENAEKKFPLYMKNIKLPEGARFEEIEVYRVCRTGKVEPESFLNTYEEMLQNSVQIRDLDLDDVKTYSMSCNSKEKDIKRKLYFFNKKQAGIPIVAKGITAIDCGKMQFTKEREKTSDKSHVDFWLYESAQPHLYFKEVQIS